MSLGIEALQTLSQEGYLSIPFDEHLRDQSIMLARTFFDLPFDERMKVAAARGDDFLGFIPSEREVEARKLDIPVFSGSRRRGYASYDLTGDPRAFSASGLKCSNKWPDNPSFVAAAKRVYRTLRRNALSISREIFGLIDQNFGAKLPLSAIEGRTCSMMRLLHYETACTNELSKSHTDYEFLAVLIADAPGLQIQVENGRWMDIPLNESRCVILPGDMLAMASGQRIKATVHRVSFGSVSRLSVAYLQGMNYRTRIPYPGLKGETFFGDHICSMKVRGTPHLERAYDEGKLRLRFEVPQRNPLLPRNRLS